MATPGATAEDVLKKEKFDKEVRLLFKHVTQSLITLYGKSDNKDYDRTAAYQKLYTSMRPHEHYEFFEYIFNRHRAAILAGGGTWLISTNIEINFGAGKEKLEKHGEKYAITLTKAYMAALKLQEQARKATEGLEAMQNVVDDVDLIMPEVILLHTTRIFYHLTSGDTKIEIGKLVTDLEEQLSVETKTVAPMNSTRISEEPRTTTMPDGTSVPTPGGLAGLFSLATGLMKNMGVNIPTGLKAPSEADLSGVIERVIGSPETQAALQSVVGGLKNSTSLSEAINSVIAGVADPANLQRLQAAAIASGANRLQGEGANAGPGPQDLPPPDVPNV